MNNRMMQGRQFGRDNIRYMSKYYPLFLDGNWRYSCRLLYYGVIRGVDIDRLIARRIDIELVKQIYRELDILLDRMKNKLVA